MRREPARVVQSLRVSTHRRDTVKNATAENMWNHSEAFDDAGGGEEVSGVWASPAQAANAVAPDVDEPTPVYASVLVQQANGRYRKQTFYLGTRFDLGIIPSACWRDDIQTANLDPASLETIAEWLSERQI